MNGIPAIETEHLTRRFDAFTAVEDLTLTVRPGEVFGFLGPNGAGKTTVMRMLSALIRPTDGVARVLGHDVVTEGEAIRRKIGLLTETPGLYRKLSAEENLRYYARLYGVQNVSQAIERYLRLLGLYERRHDPVGSFSKGMRQKIAIARALIHDPQLVYLDEPTSGLDPEAARLVLDFVLELRAQGRTVFLCTHLLDEAERLCDRVGVFKRRLIAVDTPARLRSTRFGSRTVIDLVRRDDRLLQALSGLPFIQGLLWRNHELVVILSSPEEQNPVVIRTLVEAGAEIRFVREEKASLEQVYLSLTGSLRLE
ncbi:MAG TPA: ABC transporter ATP-binding protein [Stenomitos sp.]